MNIGLTYDLRQDYLDLGYGEEETAEFDRESTIQAIESTLQKLGHTTNRIGNIWNLTKRLAQNHRWDLVFNIAEGLRGIGREAQVPALLEAYNIPYTFSDPFILALTLHKGMTKRVLRDCAVPTADFVEIYNLKNVQKVSLPFPLFAKPIAEGTGKGINEYSKIDNHKDLIGVCEYLLHTFHQPVLVETFLPGREFTVGIIGTGANARSVGTVEVILKDNAEQNAYSYVNKERCEEFVVYQPAKNFTAQKAEKIALDAWRVLGCRDAGRVDLRSDENGTPHLMELNPLAGLHPEHSDLPIICTLHGISYAELFQMILDSVIERYPALKAQTGEVHTMAAL